MEGARLAFCDAEGSTHIAFLPRRFIEHVVAADADTPEIDLWIRENAASVSLAIVDCNAFKKLEPPFDLIRAGGTHPTPASAVEE